MQTLSLEVVRRSWRLGRWLLLIGLLAAAPMAFAGWTPAPASSVVASQGGANVTLADVDAFANTIPQDQRAGVFASPKRIARLLKTLLARKQLLAEAYKLHLQNQPKLAADADRDTDGTLVHARLEALRTKIAAQVPDLDELAHERYMADPDQFTIPQAVEVKQILISTRHRSEAEAKALADKLATALKADPNAFEADVSTYSDDPSKAENHGVMDDATSGKYVPAFRHAAASLKTVGEITGPVKSHYGFHILKLVKITPARKRSFAQVHDALLKKLRANYIDQHVRHHLDVIRNHKITANKALVASLRTRYDVTSGPSASKPSASVGASAAQ